jgi:EDD domain protein, DegV family
MDPVILIDSCSDLPLEYVEKNGLNALGLTCLFKGKEYEDDFGKTLEYTNFYNGMRNGEVPITSQINSYRFEQAFKKYASESRPVIYIGFSSALSGCVNSAQTARENVLKEYGNADITVIDTKSASLGEGLLVYYAVKLLNEEKSKEEIVDWVENNKLKLNHWFTVEDLKYLRRGGRLSAVSTAIGTILDIKPVLHVDNEGRLIPVTKVTGRKKSLKALAERLEEMIVNPEEQVIAISHGDCLKDVEYLKELIFKKCKVKDIIVNNVGPVIGSHSGPGTVALFFLGENR